MTALSTSRAASALLSAEKLGSAIGAATRGLLDLQAADGHWRFEFEADCTITAEYILLMHYTSEFDDVLQERLARFIRSKQADHGGWPLYYAGAFDLSCSVKAYYALKAAGDSPDAPHMRRAREAILNQGGAARSNVFTRILLALFEQVPWRATPYVPAEVMLLPKWFPFHIYKISSWARGVMVPLLILCTLKPKAKNPRGVDIRELFVTPPEDEQNYFASRGVLDKLFLTLDRVGRICDPLIPDFVRREAIKRAEHWFAPRLNGEDGLAGIFPAMVNAYEAMELLGYEPDHPLRACCMDSLRKLLRHREDGTTYCQPCLSPTWDTGWAIMALLHADEPEASKAAIDRAVDWLLPRQILEATGDWVEGAKNPPQPGGWAFQYSNPYFPDIDDTAVIAGVLQLVDRDTHRLEERVNRAADWMLGLQSSNGGFGAYDCDNHHYYINRIPFADHGAMLDPPTEDVSGRVLACLGVMNRAKDQPAIARCVEYLKSTQQEDGSWWGRWGTNYIYGTWSALAGLMQVGEDPRQPYVRRAVDWLLARQNADGGWGETCDSYDDPGLRGTHSGESIPEVAAWSILALLACGEVGSPAVARGIGYLVEAQAADGLWHHPFFNAPGFPRVFYIKYYGYSAYFPLWALTRYRTLAARASLA